MLGVNASGADVQAIGQKPAGSSGRLQTEVGGFIPPVQLPTEALAEDPSTEPQNEDLDIADRLVEVKDGYEFGEGNNERERLLQPLQIKGNLRRNLDFWIHIGAPKFILSVIANGYCLPFQSTPVCIGSNNKSALKFKDFVKEAIEELLLTNRVVEKLNPPYVVNPLSVFVQADGKKRLILDLRHVNKYLIKWKVKYEDWKVALAFFQKDCYMVSFDLKSGYYHVEIHEDHQCFWDSAGNLGTV